MSDLELAEYLRFVRDYVTGDRLDALASKVIPWLDALEAGDRWQVTVRREALERELEDLGARLRDSSTRSEGASPPTTGAVQHDTPQPDPELIRKLREQYQQPGQR